MLCPSCQSENPNAAKFCIECGAPFSNRCPKCGAGNLSRAKFCVECGLSLGAAAIASAPHSASQDGERRHLTVLFCDLMGSTAIATQMDPEEWRTTVGEYHRTAAEAITRFGGHVAKYLGDGTIPLVLPLPEANLDSHTPNSDASLFRCTDVLLPRC